MLPAPPGYEDLYADDGQAYLNLAVLLADGSPVNVPLWFVDEPDGSLLFETGSDALKARALRRDPRVACAILAEGECARFVHVRGIAREADELDPSEIHVRIVRKYKNTDPSSIPPMSVFRITPTRVTGYDYRDFPS